MKEKGRWWSVRQEKENVRPSRPRSNGLQARSITFSFTSFLPTFGSSNHQLAYKREERKSQLIEEPTWQDCAREEAWASYGVTDHVNLGLRPNQGFTGHASLLTLDSCGRIGSSVTSFLLFAFVTDMRANQSAAGIVSFCLHFLLIKT